MQDVAEAEIREGETGKFGLQKGKDREEKGEKVEGFVSGSVPKYPST